YTPLLGTEVDELRALAKPLQGRRVEMVNSTAVGGGVAEILSRIIPLLGDLGLQPHWEVMSGTQEFFEITKAFHNALHGYPFNAKPEIFDTFRAVTEMNRQRLHLDSEFVVIHDPQPAGFIESRPQGTSHWTWRCHIDLSHPNEAVWNFLE